MPEKPLRIIIDTNLWISFLLTTRFEFLTPAILNKEVVLLFSEELLTEILDVSGRTKFSHRISKVDLKNLVTVFEEYGEMISVKSSVNLCRDAKDNFLLALAIDSKADYLVTGDQDLLVLEKISSTPIISIKELSSFMRG